VTRMTQGCALAFTRVEESPRVSQEPSKNRGPLCRTYTFPTFQEGPAVSTIARRDRTQARIRVLTALSSAGAVLGTAGVAWSMTPDAVPAAVTPAAPAQAPVNVRSAPPSLHSPAAAAPRKQRPVVRARHVAPPAPVTTSGGS
jgi:hypothetical protein